LPYGYRDKGCWPSKVLGRMTDSREDKFRKGGHRGIGTKQGAGGATSLITGGGAGKKPWGPD